MTMEELTIEEKARAYDEAKARMSKAWNNNRCTLGFMNEIFPELKESEDERIWIINYLSNRILNSTIIAEKENLKKAIAWVEKQGEQKPVFEMKTPEESLGIDSETYNKIVDECVYGEQNPAWSKEDEKEVAVLEAYIRSNDWSESHIDRALGIVDELVNKVKSLKDRYTWKPSDEQIEALVSAIDVMIDNRGAGDKKTILLSGLYHELKTL